MATDRYFKNPFRDYKDGDEAIFPENEAKILELIKKYVELIIEKTHPLRTGRNRRGDLYVGDAGIAYMLLKVHKYLKNLFTIPALEYANLYVETAKGNISQQPEKDCGFLSGNAGIYAMSAVISHLGEHKAATATDVKDYLKVSVVLFREI